MKSGLATVGLVTALALAPIPATAHHSFAMFDLKTTVTKKGTVKDWKWANPHVWLDIMVAKDKGPPELWSFEAGPTNSLKRSGWQSSTLKQGDIVTLTFHPMRNGSNAGSLNSVTLPNGRTMAMGFQGARPTDEEKLR